MNNFYLRKINAIFLAGVVFTFCGMPVFAESTEKESSITSVLTAAEETPISVKNAELTFTIDPKDETNARVTADYILMNPTNKTISVNLFTPTIGTMEGSRLTVDGAETAAQVNKVNKIHTGEPLPDGVIMDISDLVSLFSRSEHGTYQIKNFKPDDIVRVYAVSRSSEGKDTVVYPAGSTLFAPENDGYDQSGNTVHLDSRSLKNTYKIYLLNGESLTVNQKKAEPVLKMKMKDLALEFKNTIISTARPDTSGISNQDYLNQFYQHVDVLIQDGGVIAASELYGADTQNYTVLSDKVSIPAGKSKKIKVSYNIKAKKPNEHMDRNSIIYQCLFTPGKNWASFNNLKITVIPGPNHDNMDYSAFNMKRNNDGSYSVVFNTLPKKDFSFVLGKSSTKSALTGIVSQINMADLIGIFIVIIILILAVIIIRRLIKHKT